MAGFAGLKTPYALFIIVLMVLGVVATAFFFYNAANQNPCGNPGDAQFSSLPDTTITVNGQPRTYHAVAANFTGTNQVEVISSVSFLTTAFNDPLQLHLINGNCASDPYTPASVTVRVVNSITGQQVTLPSLSFRGTTSCAVPTDCQRFTGDGLAGLEWDPSTTYLTLLVAS